MCVSVSAIDKATNKPCDPVSIRGAVVVFKSEAVKLFDCGSVLVSVSKCTKIIPNVFKINLK